MAAVNYIAESDVDALIRKCERKTLFSETRDVSSYDHDAFVKACEHASSLAASAAKNAGYPVANDDPDPVLVMCAVGILLRIAYARNQIKIPSSIDALFASLPDGIYTGAIPLICTDADPLHGVGGNAAASGTDSTSAPMPGGVCDTRCGGRNRSDITRRF